MITLLVLKQIVPTTKTAVLEPFIEPLNAAMEEWEIVNPLREAAFLAQCAHESGGFHYTRELASGAAYDNRTDLGNTKPEAIRIAKENGTTPGRFFRGAGLIQCTGYDVFHACNVALSVDCLNRPELLTEPENAARSAAWFWWSRKLNELADANNFRKITIKINGGLNGWPERLAYWERAKEALA